MRPYSKTNWGNILLVLMDECKTTSQIAYELELPVQVIRYETILMHHFDLIEPIGVRTDTTDGSGYARDILWQMTTHSKDHSDIEPGCRGCRIREQLFLTEVLYE